MYTVHTLNVATVDLWSEKVTGGMTTEAISKATAG